VSDRQGNIWIANCGNNTVTRYAGGQPNASRSIPLDIEKPFDIAFNLHGQAFMTGDGDNAVETLNPDGSPALPLPITGGGLDKPMGIAADIQGNMWVANSGFADVPCPTGSAPPHHHPATLTLINTNGTLAPGQPFTGGGLTAPWGVAVDGHDNVWVSNFGGQRLSEFCGMQTASCPRGQRTGQPITPDTGYGFDGLVRNTGVQIDPSGNVWLANNWKTYPFPRRNPGGYQMVVFIGLAGPLHTPLIGPPKPL
jgi:DNA-binding beta-propeller fold protein YncE